MAATTAPGSPMLALPSAERPRPANLFNVGVLLAVTGGIVGIGAFIAAWVAVSQKTHPWPPKGVTLSNYSGTMLVLTMLMSAVTVEWGVYAARRDQRSQSVAAFAMSIGLGLAFLNLLWFFGRRLGFGPAASPYAVLLYSMIAVMGVGVVVGIAVLIAVTARVLGLQVRAGNVEMARSAAFFWQFLVLAWVVVYATVWLFS